MHIKWVLDISSDEHKKLTAARTENVFYIIGSGVLAVLLIMNILSFSKISKEQRAYKQSTQTGATESAVSLSELSSQFTHANSILERRSFSWSRFLGRLEESVPARISIASVTPAFAGSSVSIDGTAMSIDDLVKFTGKLNNSKYFKDIFLADQKNTPGGNVGFNITFKYIDKEVTSEGKAR